MKRFYTSLMLMIAAMVGFVASAATVSITVKVNDPALCTVTPYCSLGMMDTLVFDDQNEAYVEFPDGCSLYTMMLYVTPVTPEGSSDPVYLKTITVYDCDGEQVSTKTYNKTTKSTVSIYTSADGGLVDINCGTMGQQKLNVDIQGDPSKVKLMVDNKTISGLTSGMQQIEFAPGTRVVAVYPKGGLTQLYRVTYNGVVQNPRAEAAEGGALTYYYLINSPTDGSTLVIEPDYPDVDFTVTIECNDPDFVTNITVNDKPRDLATSFTVKAGNNVSVKGDAFNYIVLSCAVNDVPTEAAAASMSRVIKEDTKFTFNVERIERPLTYVAYVGNANDTWLAHTATGQNAYLKGGYTVVPLAVTDNPVSFSVYSTAYTTDDGVRFVYVNDERVESDFADTYLTLADNDVVKLFYNKETQEPQLQPVTFTREGFSDALAVTKDLVTVVADAAEGFQAFPGTYVNFSAPAGVEVNYVTVNGSAITADEEGVYSFTVEGATKVNVSGASSGIDAVSADTASECLKVFNTQGMLLNSCGNLSNLPAGLYIVGGKKVVVK